MIKKTRRQIDAALKAKIALEDAARAVECCGQDSREPEIEKLRAWIGQATVE